MVEASIVKFSDVKNSPEIRMNLPLPIPLGSKIKLALKLKRVNKGRTEELRVNGEFQVISVVTDLTRGKTKQLVTISSIGVAPSWVAVKNQTTTRNLAPTRSAPTKVL